MIRQCPCCGALPMATRFDGLFQFTCSKFGCRKVEAKTQWEAEKLWNEPRFSDK